MLYAFAPSISVPMWMRLGLRLKRPFLQGFLLLAVGLALFPGNQVYAEDSQTLDTGEKLRLTSSLQAQQAAPSAPVFPESGRYLFGQVSQRDQLGQGYIVLESTGNEVFGALYYPSSSFDCFQGQVQSGQLAMTITNSYTQETYPYSIALVSDTAIASTAPDALQPLSLQGFHQIDALNDNDLRLLETCRATVNPSL